MGAKKGNAVIEKGFEMIKINAEEKDKEIMDINRI